MHLDGRIYDGSRGRIDLIGNRNRGHLGDLCALGVLVVGLSLSLLEESHEFLDAQARLANDGTERAAIEHGVIGNDDLTEGVVSPEDDMAARLSAARKAGPLEGGDGRACRR